MPVAGTIAVMELTAIEIALVEQFRQTLPPGEATVDFYLAVGYFRTLGLSEGAAHRLAEHVSTKE